MVAFHRNVKDVWCGGNHTIITKDENVLACGRNDHGQCGLGNTISGNKFMEIHYLYVSYQNDNPSPDWFNLADFLSPDLALHMISKRFLLRQGLRTVLF